jgi:hypothetical protein
LTYSSEFVVAVYVRITVTRSIAQSPAFWRPSKILLGSINWTKSDYMFFVAPMMGMDGSCSARAHVSD